MICYVLAMGKHHLGPHVVVGYGIKFFGRAFPLRHQITWKFVAGLKINSPGLDVLSLHMIHSNCVHSHVFTWLIKA